MNGTISTWDTWQPQSSQDREAILHELREVVASPHFCNSKRYPALLQFIVESTLAGKSELLKERTLGVEVFDRPPTYDTNTDTVVRYTAGEVRKRLLLYYSEHGRDSSIRISLPAGSYIPEFLLEQDKAESTVKGLGNSEEHSPDANVVDTPVEVPEAGFASRLDVGGRPSPSVPLKETGPKPQPKQTTPLTRSLLWLALAVIAALSIIVGIKWRDGVRPQTVVDDFWAPVIRDQHLVVLCTGGVIFQNNKFSGVITAGKDIEYPFVSMQIASAISQISSLLDRLGATTQLQAAPSTPLTELREHSLVLMGGYNNQWTMRLLEPLRFYFTPEPGETIADRMHPQTRWFRDKSLPYSSADDYALVARFRDTTTDGWVVVLAGIGRNGSEAAAQFVASPHYLQLVKDQIGNDFSNHNIEVVLKVRVIDGKTGAPSILAVHSW
jgi:hypothetical protein